MLFLHLAFIEQYGQPMSALLPISEVNDSHYNVLS